MIWGALIFGGIAAFYVLAKDLSKVKTSSRP